MIRRGMWLAVALASLLLAVRPAGAAAVISVGAFPELSPAPSIVIPADTFLVPVQVAGADKLQNWQFDLLFDNTVVEQVDPLDGTSGLYGAEFTPGDASTTSFILGGFAFNGLGLVDDIAGFHPALLDGVSGAGVLAYVLFRFLDGQQGADPDFSIADVVIPQQVPGPGALVLLAVGVTLLSSSRRTAPKGPRARA